MNEERQTVDSQPDTSGHANPEALGTVRWKCIGSAERGHSLRWMWFPRHREVGVYIWRLYFEWVLPHFFVRRDGERWSEWTAGSFRILLFDKERR